MKKALREVERRLPIELWRTLSAGVEKLKGLNEYDSVAWSENPLPTSAGLFPLWKRSELGTPGTRPRLQILIFLPVFRRFSHRSQVGILAHEFAHVHDALALPGDWHQVMQNRYAEGEDAAERLAISWGFGMEIKTLRIERDTLNQRLLPILAKRVFEDYL